MDVSVVLGTCSKVPIWFPFDSHLVPSNLAGNHRNFDSRFGSQLVPSTSRNFPAPLLGTTRILIPSRPFFQKKSLVFASKFSFLKIAPAASQISHRPVGSQQPCWEPPGFLLPDRSQLVPSSLAGNHQNFDSQPFPFGSQHQPQFPSNLAGNELLGALPFGRV